MVEHYLVALRTLLDRAAAQTDAITCEHFFSGAVVYVDGKIFASLTPAGLALKLPEAARGALLDAGGAPLRYFPKAPIKKEYVIVPACIADDDAALAPWLSSSIGYSRGN